MLSKLIDLLVPFKIRSQIYFSIIEVPFAELSSEEEGEKEDPKLPEIRLEMQEVLLKSLRLKENVAIIKRYSIPIYKKDLDTLHGLN